jgi:hypothetical protein
VQDGTLRECQKLLELEAHGGRGASEGTARMADMLRYVILLCIHATLS